jgi:hypothetical protein
MKIALRSTADAIPHVSALCWNRTGVLNVVNMVTCRAVRAVGDKFEEKKEEVKNPDLSVSCKKANTDVVVIIT